MATATEQIGREGRGGSQSTRVSIYHVYDATGVQDAVDTTLTQVTTDLGGTTLDGLALTGIDPRETSVAGNYLVRVTWGQARGISQQKQNDESRFTFEFSQETIRAKYSFNTERFGLRVPDRGNAVNQRTDSDGRRVIEGIDVPSPAFTFGKTITVAVADITTIMANAASVYLHVNNATFAGFPAKQVLFTGLTGGQRDDDNVELTYRFARQPNIIEEAIGGISGVTKYGWEYLEPYTIQEVATDDQSTEVGLKESIKGWYVHTMFPPGDFSTLNLE